MKILVACEESQEVCKAFRAKGHEAYSCDIIPQSGGHDEWHIMQDVLPLLNGNCTFKTCDGLSHNIIGKWDMIIAFPPCTDLCVSGARHFEEKRKDGRQRDSIIFFARFLNADCDKICIENPVGIISGTYILQHYKDLCKEYNLPRNYTQKVQPYYFGHHDKKTTCLWLKNLPRLIPTNVVEPNLTQYVCADGRVVTFSDHLVKGFKSSERAKARSKTAHGLALAMAEQWG